MLRQIERCIVSSLFCCAILHNTAAAADSTISPTQKPKIAAVRPSSHAGLQGESLSPAIPESIEAAIAADYYTVDPCRILDTRLGTQINSTPRTVQIVEACKIPPLATAISGNVTVAAPATSGELIVYPQGPTPVVYSLPYNGGQTRANNFTSGLTDTGTGTLQIVASTPVDAIIDVTGYFMTLPSTHFCDGQCVGLGHFTYSGAEYPFTEDITGQNTLPFRNPVVVPAGNNWTPMAGGCQLINGANFQASVPVNALLRGMTSVVQAMGGYTSTAAVGARYEVQLLIDGLQYGWYQRRVRAYPQREYFEATAQNIPVGDHHYTLAVRLLDPGQLIFDQRWITATGAPNVNPSMKSVLTGAIILTPSFQTVSDTLAFTTVSTSDLIMNGYMELDGGAPGERITVEFLADSFKAHTASVYVPPYGGGVNLVDYRLNVAPGSHTLRWQAKTTTGTVSATLRSVEFVSVPAYQGISTLVSAESFRKDSVVVSTSYGGPQPIGLTGCGAWTPLITLAPNTVAGSATLSMSGYVQVSQILTGGPGIIDFVITHDQAGYELGTIAIGDVSSPNGYFFFSDASTDVGCAGCTITLWARRLDNTACLNDPRVGPGSFSVGHRFLAAKWTPMGGCRY